MTSYAAINNRNVMIERILAAIEPDTEAGERAVLPRIERHRPTGSTSEVSFRTLKKCKETRKSHVSHVVLDSMVWEGAAAWYLERADFVKAYVKNDRLDFEIAYQWELGEHVYRPDFLVTMDLGRERTATLILEMKGRTMEQDRTKWMGAEKWVRAVNNHGGFGRWAFRVCERPNELEGLLRKWRDELAAD